MYSIVQGYILLPNLESTPPLLFSTWKCSDTQSYLLLFSHKQPRYKMAAKNARVYYFEVQFPSERGFPTAPPRSSSGTSGNVELLFKILYLNVSLLSTSFLANWICLRLPICSTEQGCGVRAGVAGVGWFWRESNEFLESESDIFFVWSRSRSL